MVWEADHIFMENEERPRPYKFQTSISALFQFPTGGEIVLTTKQSEHVAWLDDFRNLLYQTN